MIPSPASGNARIAAPLVPSSTPRLVANGIPRESGLVAIGVYAERNAPRPSSCRVIRVRHYIDRSMMTGSHATQRQRTHRKVHALPYLQPCETARAQVGQRARPFTTPASEERVGPPRDARGGARSAAGCAHPDSDHGRDAANFTRAATFSTASSVSTGARDPLRALTSVAISRRISSCAACPSSRFTCASLLRVIMRAAVSRDTFQNPCKRARAACTATGTSCARASRRSSVIAGAPAHQVRPSNIGRRGRATEVAVSPRRRRPAASRARPARHVLEACGAPTAAGQAGTSGLACEPLASGAIASGYKSYRASFARLRGAAHELVDLWSQSVSPSIESGASRPPPTHHFARDHLPWARRRARGLRATGDVLT